MIKKIGRYEIISKIGEGGISIVYKAFDSVLQRNVALKVLKIIDPVLLRRFFREARTQAGIEHENICRIYDYGEIDEIPFIAMQLIEGKPLDEAVKGMSIERKLIIIKKVADALHEAHKKGLIHRDLKPSNIMVEIREDGEEKPYLIDFGLVKEIDKFDSTFPGMIVGTLGYMAPEQIEGKTDEIDRRTDVYGLGAVLYTILTGEPPFKGETVETFKKAIEEEPIPLRKFKKNIPKDVENIVIKCLEKKPERRYQSAKEFSEDIERFLKGEPIKAKSYGFPYRILKKIKRNKTVFAISSIAMIIIIFLIVFAIHIQHKERLKRNYSIEFEQQVKYIEDMLWYTYSLPLHDIREEIKGVKDRLNQIEKRFKQLGEIAYGPGYYALGRGYFALHEYEKAKDYLELAWNKYKYRIPNVSYFLSLSLTMLYDKENKNADRIIDREVRNKIKDEIRKKYETRIREFTQKGKGTEIETWEYLDVLKAYQDKKYSIALERIETLKKKFPWFYDAIKLEGEIYRKLGLEFMNKGKKEESINNFLKAEEVLLDLSKKSESDPEVYKALSGLEINFIELLIYQTGESPEQRFKWAVHYAQNALTANPEDEEAYNLLSHAYWRFGSYLLYKGEDPTEYIQKSIEFSKKAIDLNPNNPFSYAHIAASYLELGAYLNSAGKNPREYLENSILYSEKALKLNSSDLQSYNNMGLAFWNISQWEIRAGNNPLPYFEKGIEILEEGIKVNPQISTLFHTLGNIYLEKAVYEKSQNFDISDSLKKARESYEKAILLNPSNSLSYNGIAECFLVEGNLNIEKGNSPEPALNLARFYLKKSLHIKPNFLYAFICGARIELAEARWKIINGEDPEPFFEKAIEFIKKSNDLNPLSVSLFEVKGEVYRLRAEWEMRKGVSPVSTAEEGIAEMNKAIESTSCSGEIFLTRGFLYLIKGKFEKKKEFYQKAINDFKKSFSLSPDFEKEYSHFLKEAEKALYRKD